MSTAEHEHWDQLAVGHALHALSAAQERVFARHVAGCSRCTEAIAAHAGVTERLGELAYATPPPALRDRVLAVTDPPVRRKPPVWLAAAAAVALVGAGIGLASREISPRTTQAALRVCADERGCTGLPLLAPGKAHEVGAVLVRGTTAQLVIDGLEVNDRSRTTYVLWQKAGKGAPLALAAFDVTGATTTLRRELRAPLARTSWLAVSVEQGRVAPLTPSVPVAVAVVSTR